MTPAEHEAAMIIESRTTQSILDAQGFVVLIDIQDREPGTVIPLWHCGKGSDHIVMPGPLVVTGMATRQEYVAQCERFFSHSK